MNDIAKKMKNSINILKITGWYNSLSEKNDFDIPYVMFQDSRYSIIYKVYLELKKDKFSVELDSKYAFQMKRTDKLYEIWCYIKICRILKEELNFEIIDGWIFEQEINNKKLIVSELKSNTRIAFKNNDIIMNLTYDFPIPRSDSETSKFKDPLYSIRNSNRTDGRLDIYKNKVYIGSIIFEFKYRDRKYLWNYSSKSNNCITPQLLDYASGCKSSYIFSSECESSNIFSRRLTPVNNVFVLCPESTYNKNEIHEVEDYCLKFINFKPNKNLELLKDKINNEIKRLEIEYEEFISR
ncbi:nuclease domain-containing protein [Clostridium mediterraneense]|uniref:nuclease domain-containing protein n=1 Tax=Clostridium mediterraneense TaxID=1805472 RepID=UPI00082EC0DC|nr:nuclease domain-containing protein [Clostridium mediterraneense]